MYTNIDYDRRSLQNALFKGNFIRAFEKVNENILSKNWSLYENESSQEETVFRPDMKLTVNFTPWLKWVSQASYNYYGVKYESKQPGSGYANEGGSYRLRNTTKQQLNANTNLMFNYDINKDWNINGFLRGEYYNNHQYMLEEWTDGGLVVPNQYFLANSKNGIQSSGKIFGNKTILSVAGQFSVSWRNQIYVDVTGRNDWSSSLVYADGHGNYSYFYPSVNGSWILSETFKMPSWISFLKLRGSWAQVGNDTDAYLINSAYSLNTSTKDGHKIYSLSIPSTAYDANLKPERKNSWEVGLDWRVLNGRIGLDATYYKENTTDQIMSVSVPSASGVSTALINAGNIQNSGVEIALNTIPVQTKDFSWDLNFTFTKNNSKIVELSDKGAVITLEDGVEGFCTTRHLQKENKEEAPAKKGDTMSFRVIEFNKDAKRILLSHLRTWEARPETPAKEGKPAAKKEPAVEMPKMEKTTLGDLDVLANLKASMTEEEKPAEKAPKAAKAEKAEKPAKKTTKKAEKEAEKAE